MRTFHLDFNTALFRPDTVSAWLHDLSELGFDTLLWEVENAFQWQSCPECAVPDTLPMEELRRLLDLASSLGFENIPLLQTLGHCEYVLKHKRYAHLSEDGHIDQYCPLNPDVLPFLESWIDETMEIFGSPRLFHVGADETWQLGVCPQCANHAKANGIGDLFRIHMDRVIEMVVARGARPLLWADMFLSHPETLPGLSQEAILCDWAYERDDHSTEVYLFDHGKFPVERAAASAIEAFGDRLYRPGTDRTQLNPWVAADHLAAQGFDLILCPASSHAGDAVFAPRTDLHLRNIGDTVHYADQIGALGTILTSWTWSLFPWELQRPLMVYYIAAAEAKKPDRDEFLNAYGSSRLSLPADTFARVCRLLETPCPLTDVDQLFFYKGGINRRPNALTDFLAERRENGQASRLLDEATAAETVYEEAIASITVSTNPQNKAHPEWKAWRLAADCLFVRARSARHLFSDPTTPNDYSRPALELAANESRQRQLCLNAFLANVLPHRAEEMVSCQFDDVVRALKI